MLTTDLLVQRLIGLKNGDHAADPRDVFASRLSRLRPIGAISTYDWTAENRKMVGPTGDLVDFNPDLTPYTRGIMQACDKPEVRLVAVKGNTRSGKTVAAECVALKHWDIGPLVNVLWFMQDEDSINDYIDERGEEMLRIHPGVNEKIDWTDRRNSRKRKVIGGRTVFWRPATMRSTRGKAAPLIIADEIDAYQKKVRDAIAGLVENRQREYGAGALAYLASHPDAGPDGGIDSILVDCLQHLWTACCPDCGHAGGFAAESEVRFHWNVAELLKAHMSEQRSALLDILLQEARLICPNPRCARTFDNQERLKLSGTGAWLQPHQTMHEGVIEGEELVSDKMGFVIHAMMAPFIDLGKTARDWAAAKLQADMTGNDINLRERTVKDLGETYLGTRDEEKTESWKIVEKRLASPYELKQVPRGVRFLTQFVDVQGDRFEVVVIGWSLAMESWLIDRYPIKQWPAFGKHAAFDTIDPGNRLTDWDILEESCLIARYPLASNPDLYLPIAKTVINAAGQAGVTNNAYVWWSNIQAREPGQGRIIHPSHVTLFQGSAHTKRKDKNKPTAPLYGVARPVEFDDKQRPLKTQIYARTFNVHEIKKIIMRRMKIEEAGPGAMHTPMRLPSRYIRELVSERLINDEWISNGTSRNETWDGWVACEAARGLIKPDRPGLFDDPQNLPYWATPVARDAGIDTLPSGALSVFDRLAQINEGAKGTR